MPSPEIITEPVVHDDLVERLRRIEKAVALLPSPDTGSVPVPIGLVGAAVDIIDYWQAVGPRLAGHGILARAEMEATFDRALAKAGLTGWSCWGHSASVGPIITVGARPGVCLFTARWVEPGKVFAGVMVETACWYSEHGYCHGPHTGAVDPDIASLLARHKARIEASNEC